VRVCLAAESSGIDISGTLFNVGGEPFTPGKATVLADAGALVAPLYGATELGIAGVGCGVPATIDDLHLATDRLFVSSHMRAVDDSGATIPVLVYTTLSTNCRKLMINAEIGDYGHLEERDCGCPLGAAGLNTHLTGLHGYDKLTSDGVTFLGNQLYTLLEEILPSRFGGTPIDYQLAEEEDEHGIAQVSIVVAPRVGHLDEVEIVEFTLNWLRTAYYQRQRGPLMAETWRNGNTLRVIRREPHSPGGRKVLPLHIVSPVQPTGQPS
jgi:hypothetical protein